MLKEAPQNRMQVAAHNRATVPVAACPHCGRPLSRPVGDELELGVFIDGKLTKVRLSMTELEQRRGMVTL